MRAADYIKSAWGNLKGRKKTGKAMKYLLFTALLIYFIGKIIYGADKQSSACENIDGG